MRIVWIIPGSGESFYCENCLRDFAMLRALRALGHDVAMVPMYLPLDVEREAAQPQAQESRRSEAIFFGGINVYLQQKFPLFRRTPRWLDALWDRAGLLRFAGRLSGMVKADQLKQTLLSMLRGLEGRQAKEVRRLCDHLAGERADVVVLSNALLLGLAGPIRSRLGAPIACYLQDEDEFIDALDEPGRREIWDMLRALSSQADFFLAASGYYADKMRNTLAIPDGRIATVPGGIVVEEYGSPQPREVLAPPVIGFLSRRCYHKGPDLLVEAFCRIKRDPRLARARLRLAGGMLASDRPLQRQIRRRLVEEGVNRDVEFLPHLELLQRVEFLRSLTVLSVPERVGESGGRYVKEALACGVPVVQPQCGCFPELLAAAGGGLLFPPGDVDALTAQIIRVLTEPHLVQTLAVQGRTGVVEHYSAARCAGRLEEQLRRIVAAE